MNINCNFVKCENCDVFDVCNLHQKTSFEALKIRQQINWNVKRLNEIHNEINHFNTTLVQYKRMELSPFIMEYLNIDDIQEILENLHHERTTLRSQIRKLQIKEKNIIKILNRGMKYD